MKASIIPKHPPRPCFVTLCPDIEQSVMVYSMASAVELLGDWVTPELQQLFMHHGMRGIWIIPHPEKD